MPNISFLGHLSGILVGTLQFHGLLSKLFPSYAYLLERETDDRLEVLRRQPGYVSTPETSPLMGETVPDIRSSLLASFGCVTLFVSNVCETIKVMIFGRGSEANANIQLNELTAAWGSSDVNPNTAGAGTILDDMEEDDEEWVGLPAAIQRSTDEM